MQNRAVKFHDFGSPEVLLLTEIAVPEPRAGEVLIRTHAVGVNWADALWRQNLYVEDPVLPAGLGQEVAGTIERLGPGVTDFAVGDAVVSLPGTSQGHYPSYGEHVIMPVSHLMRQPASLSPVEAAAVPVAYLTGYFAMFELANLSAGQHVLITGASSSTGFAAIQMARAVGAIPIATTRGPTKVPLLTEAGAAEVVVTDEEDIVSRVKAITGGKGVELVYDGVGGPQFERLGEVVAHRGWYILYGLSGGIDLKFNANWPFRNSWRFHVYKVAEFTGSETMGLPKQDEAVERGIKFVTEGIESRALRPRVDRIFPLADVVEAHKYLERGRHVGKVVLTVE